MLKSNSLNQKDKYCQTRTEKNTKVLIMTTNVILTISVFLKLLLSTGFLYFICFNSYFNMIGNHFKFFGIRLQILRSIWDKSFWGFFSYLSFWKKSGLMSPNNFLNQTFLGGNYHIPMKCVRTLTKNKHFQVGRFFVRWFIENNFITKSAFTCSNSIMKTYR